MGSKIDSKVFGVAAAAAGTMVAGGTAQAAVIAYSGAPIPITNGNTGNIDVNGDSVSDVGIGNQNNAKNNNHRYYVNGVTGDAQYAISPYALDATQSIRPTAFVGGATVGAGLTYGLDSGGLSNTLAGLNANSADGGTPGYNGGLFTQDGITVNYIGVKLTPATGGTFYGYVGITLGAVTGTDASVGTVVSYAFENTPDTAITTPGGAVPEPASLAVLALGATALLKRRASN